MKVIKFLLLSFPLLGMLSSCSSDLLDFENPVAESTVVQNTFTLNVTSEDVANTRLALGEDGMTMLWEYGDHLVLVNTETNDSIQMIANIAEGAEPTPSCSFTSEEGVKKGTYWVLCNGRSQDRMYQNKRLFTKEEIRDGKLLKLYSTLTVADNQTTASIVLKNVYAKVRFNFINAGPYATYTNSMYLKMANSHGKIRDKIQLMPDGTFKTVTTGFKNTNFTNGSCKQYIGGNDTYYALLLPQDLQGENVYFYILYSYQNQIVEFKKPGINLEAGKSYVINLDFNNATIVPNQTDERGFMVTDAASLRACAATGANASIQNDIDLSGEDVFPLSGTIQGNGHTIKNLVINAPNTRYVALTDNQHAYNLTIENANISGLDHVAAFTTGIGTGVGSTLSLNCHLKGVCTITSPGDYVAGICADLNHDVVTSGYIHLTDCSVDGDITISGKNYVGGAVGHINSGVKNMTIGSGVRVTGENYVGGVIGATSSATFCTSAATVSGIKFVGGISGRFSGGATEKCGNQGNITGTTYVGGISGHNQNASTLYCYNTGTITGESYLGGIEGYSAFHSYRLCYNSGSIIASENGEDIGGIVGHTHGMDNGPIYVTDCYSIGSIRGGAKAVGGIVGLSNRRTAIEYCYSSTPNSSDTFEGILGKDLNGSTVQACLTSQPTIASFGGTVAETSMANVTNIMNNLAVINGNNSYSSSAYYMWPSTVYSANCPVFVWQTNPLTTGGSVYAPSFGEEIEW